MTLIQISPIQARSFRAIFFVVLVGLAAGFLSAQAESLVLASTVVVTSAVILVGAARSVVRSERLSIPRLLVFQLILVSFINFDSSSSLGADGESSLIGMGRLLLRFSVYGVGIAILLMKPPSRSVKTSHNVIPALMLFLATTMVSVVFSPGLVIAFARWLDLAAFLVLMGLISLRPAGKPETILLELYVSLAVVIGGLWLWYLYDPEHLTRLMYSAEGGDYVAYGRLGGAVVPPNTLGMLGSVLMLLGLHRILTRGIVSLSVLHISIASLAVATVVMSGSRGALLALSAAGAWMLGNSVLGWSRNHIKLISSLLVVGGAGFFSFSYLAPYLKRTPGDDSTGSLTGRTDIWEMAIGNFFGRPAMWLTGNSFGRIPNLQTPWGFTTDSPHNGYLLILIGSGLLGFVGLLWIWSFIIRSIPLISVTPTRSIVGGLVIALMVHNLTEIGTFATMNFLTVIGGALVVIAGWQMQAEKKPHGSPRRGGNSFEETSRVPSAY